MDATFGLDRYLFGSFTELPLSNGGPALPESSVNRDDFGDYVEERLQSGVTRLHTESLAWMERRLLLRVLAHTGGNKSRASHILGITRGSLRRKLARLGISVERSVDVNNMNGQ